MIWNKFDSETRVLINKSGRIVGKVFISVFGYPKQYYGFICLPEKDVRLGEFITQERAEAAVWQAASEREVLNVH